MCTKCNFLIICILLIIIGILCGYILFNNQDSKNTTTNTNTNETAKTTVTNNDYSYNTISGFYTFQEKNPNSNEEISSFGYYLYLSENGTFRYQYLMNTVSSTLGNYIIVGDEVRLNYLFNGGNDAGLSATNGAKVLKIIDKNTLVDNNAHFAKQGGSKSINLTRDTNSNYYNKDEYDVNYLINNYILDNEHKLEF